MRNENNGKKVRDRTGTFWQMPCGTRIVITDPDRSRPQITQDATGTVAVFPGGTRMVVRVAPPTESDGTKPNLR